MQLLRILFCCFIATVQAMESQETESFSVHFSIQHPLFKVSPLKLSEIHLNTSNPDLFQPHYSSAYTYASEPHYSPISLNPKDTIGHSSTFCIQYTVPLFKIPKITLDEFKIQMKEPQNFWPIREKYRKLYFLDLVAGHQRKLKELKMEPDYIVLSNEKQDDELESVRFNIFPNNHQEFEYAVYSQNCINLEVINTSGWQPPASQEQNPVQYQITYPDNRLEEKYKLLD